jgi:hypothetical protein
MKKVSLQSLVSYLTETGALPEIRDEIAAELARGVERVQANHDLYDEAKDAVMAELRNASAPVTIGELWEAVEGKVPANFSKGKMQYAITRLWKDEVVKTEGKVNTYSCKE